MDTYILTILPCVIFVAIITCKKRNMLYLVGDCMLAGYLTMTLYYITSVACLRDILSEQPVGPFSLHLLGSEGISTYLLNVLLFVPLGLLLPTFYKDMRHFIPTFFYGLTFSACIEILQIFNHRVTDIDDLVTNTIGTVVGYIIFLLIRKRLNPDPPKLVFWEPASILLLSLLGVFFLK